MSDQPIMTVNESGDTNNSAQCPKHALEYAKRVLAILEAQASGYTSLTIPAHLYVELEDKRKEVAQLEVVLESMRQLSTYAQATRMPVIYIERERRDCISLPDGNVIDIGTSAEIERASLEFHEQLNTLATSQNTLHQVFQKLAHPVEELRKAIFPAEANYHKFEDFLTTCSGMIVVQSSESDLMIPWEFLAATSENGIEEFLGRNYTFCRRSRGIPSPDLPPYKPGTETVGLLQLSAIPQAKQIQDLFLDTSTKSVRRINRYEKPTPYTRQRFEAEVSQLQKYIESLDIAHVACLYISIKCLETPVLIVDEIFTITPEDIDRLKILSKRPLIFFNPLNNGEYTSKLWIQFISAFIRRGGRKVITSIYPLPDAIATNFAKEFYRQMACAEYSDEFKVLQAAKKSVFNELHNPMVLGYTIYEPVASTPFQVFSPSQPRTITWLHISDLHFRESEYEADIVLDALIRDIAAQSNEGHKLKPDFMLVSGDIAYSGSRREYKRAEGFFRKLMEVTDIQAEKILIVPGNHDVDWTAFDDVIALGYTQKLVSLDQIDNCLGSLNEKRRIFRKFRYYQKFAHANFPYWSSTVHNYYFVKTLEIAGKRLSILGLNSAWMSAYRRKPDGKPDDRHYMILGRRQLREALEQAQKSKPDISIALMHHPTEWLHDELDRLEIEGVLQSECDFVLHGHLHKNGVLGKWSPGSKIYTIGAGASFARDDGSNRDYYGYNFTRLDLDDGIGRIYLRRYSREGRGFWTEDTASYQDAKGGICNFELNDSWL